jgi:hypothetical protein
LEWELERQHLHQQLQAIKEQLRAAVAARDNASTQLLSLATLVRRRLAVEQARMAKRSRQVAAAKLAQGEGEAAGWQEEREQLTSVVEAQQRQLLELATQYQRLTNDYRKMKAEVKSKRTQAQQDAEPPAEEAAGPPALHADQQHQQKREEQRPLPQEPPAADPQRPPPSPAASPPEVVAGAGAVPADGPPAPPVVLQFAAQFAGAEGQARPGSAPPSTLQPVHGAGEVAVPPTVQLLASHYQGGLVCKKAGVPFNSISSVHSMSSDSSYHLQKHTQVPRAPRAPRPQPPRRCSRPPAAAPRARSRQRRPHWRTPLLAPTPASGCLRAARGLPVGPGPPPTGTVGGRRGRGVSRLWGTRRWWLCWSSRAARTARPDRRPPQRRMEAVTSHLLSLPSCCLSWPLRCLKRRRGRRWREFSLGWFDR